MKYDQSFLEGAQLPSVLLGFYLHSERTAGILMYSVHSAYVRCFEINITVNIELHANVV